MLEGAGLILLGVVICVCAALDWFHPSWGSARRYFGAGIVTGLIGLGMLLFDLVM